MKRLNCVTAALLLLVGLSQAQVGPLIWEEDFSSLDHWLVETGNGSWGWGNGELQYYSPDNVAIAPVPGEPGNTALAITARRESGPGIVDQWGNPLEFTSGKVVSRSKVSVQYGMIEVRMKISSIDLGGWPAVWMLGTSNYSWPRNGELDLLEMGARQAFRDLHDTHNGGSGLDDSTVDEVVHSNAIFYTEAAVSPENPSGAASLSWDPDDLYVRPYYDQVRGLVDRFLTYRLYWDQDSLRFTVIDDGVEHDLFEEPFAIDAESDEFRAPFYLVANLAVGGAFTDAYNLGDPGSGLPVTMPFPAEMLVDYIRVYRWNGQGEVHLGPPVAQAGTFGVFTDLTPVDAALVPEVTGQIYVWEGTLTDADIAPYEGQNVLAWQTTGAGWFGAGVMSVQPLNLFEFGDGHLRFRIQIPAHVTFKIGIIDAWGNQSYVTFPAHQTTHGLVRDGQWGEAAIPVSVLRGLAMDLRMLSYPFVILEEQGAACQFAIDDITWDGGTVTSVDDGSQPSQPTWGLRASAPNPFNARTEIRFELPAPQAYRVEVFDVSGRRVASFRGLGTAGLNAVSWDGRDDAGRALASGTFTYRLLTGGVQQTGKMTLAK